MSLPWVKLHTSLVHNHDFKRFSPGAKLTFVTCLMLAGDLDQGDFSGRLEAKSGPLTVDEIAEYTRMRPALQRDAMAELIKAGFIEQDLAGAFVVARFDEKAGTESQRSQAATRQRNHRLRKRGLNPASWATIKESQGHKCALCDRGGVALTIDHVIPSSREGCDTLENLWALCRSCNSRKYDKTPAEFIESEALNLSLSGHTGTGRTIESLRLIFRDKPGCVTGCVTHNAPRNNVTDKEEEVELYASLRSAAIGYATFPEAALLPGLALIFVQRFANCRDTAKAEKHVDQYAVVLGSFSRDGYTIAETWRAFEDAWKANGEKPLFGGKAKNAYSFKPGRIAKKHAAKANDRGEEMDRAIAAKIQRQGATA